MKVLIFDTETTGLPKDYKGSIYNSDNWPYICLLYTSPSPRDQRGSRMPECA